MENSCARQRHADTHCTRNETKTVNENTSHTTQHIVHLCVKLKHKPTRYCARCSVSLLAIVYMYEKFRRKDNQNEPGVSPRWMFYFLRLVSSHLEIFIIKASQSVKNDRTETRFASFFRNFPFFFSLLFLFLYPVLCRVVP